MYQEKKFGKSNEVFWEVLLNQKDDSNVKNCCPLVDKLWLRRGF